MKLRIQDIDLYVDALKREAEICESHIIYPSDWYNPDEYIADSFYTPYQYVEFNDFTLYGCATWSADSNGDIGELEKLTIEFISDNDNDISNKIEIETYLKNTEVIWE